MGLEELEIKLNPEHLIAALESVRRYVCAYHRSNYCDCKMGAHRGLSLYPQENAAIKGEITGCPEIRLIQEIILTIKNSEMEKIVQRLISNEINDPGIALRRVEKIAKKYGAGIRQPARGFFPVDPIDPKGESK